MSSTFESHFKDNTFSSVNTADTLTAGVASPPLSKFLSSQNGSSSGIVPECIPTERPYRNLVLCFDGTGDQFDSDNSNVVELFSMLKKDDPSRQLVYYQAGIGTYTVPQIATPMFAKLSKLLDTMVAWNLDTHIMGGYEFLMQNYQVNDRICILGFSRGAYTARCLAGMIHKVGLLPSSNHQQVPFAYKMYTRTDELGWKQSNAFKKAFSIDVDIEFVGVWDTVSSVGLIPRRLPFTTSNTVIRTFRHAVSLDEHRARFQPNLWNRPDDKEKVLSISDKKKNKQKGKTVHGDRNLMASEIKYSKDKGTPTDVDEVWFSGCHCDVGGGSVSNGVKPCLARIPLRWMIRECFKTNSGIIFEADGLRRVGLDPATVYPVVVGPPPALSLDTSSPATSSIASIPKTVPPEIDDFDDDVTTLAESQEPEEVAELKDLLAPIYDQLSLKWFWWILELLPMKHRFQKSDNKWSWWFGSNMGQGRHVPSQSKNGVRVHRSVRTRLAAKDANGQTYTPKAKLDLKYVTWVD